MNNWQHLLTQEQTATVTGEWFCVRFSPDKTTGELFNVGVVFIDKDKKCHAKLLESTSVFERLFGTLGVANIKFLLTVVAETLAENHYNVSPSSHISYGPRQTAQGDSIDEILSDLYRSMISLLESPAETVDKKRQNINTKDLRKRVTSYIKGQLPDVYDNYLRDTPILVGQGANQMSLDLPLVHKYFEKSFYGTVVSADYLDDVYFTHNVEHVGVTNLANCCEILGRTIKAGISIYHPPLESQAEQAQRDERLDKCLHRLEVLRKQDYDIHIHVEPTLDKCLTTTLEMAC
ncbi:hypothetical protein MOVS_01255 [Moraxella ovis]|uniref:DUF3037 domain-containing protein n=1 Tax=Moraxella ovis TaxID=29433 RepID=A0A167ZNQ0_9GAMM|nr:DUF3037 domain-containing protein [Moraxella ovis]ANB90844.1 hypothetical protein MOVS_01255 [Moraxella ovis]SPX85366.1 Uncharacterised protein [Moraxella ovis]STY86284.1 Uncharacterised protein [Moraxella ovis]STZ06331.1 Uncharacterised protein [Moraxella ovis]